VPITPNQNIRIESLPDGTCRLIIDKTSVDDQGNYMVQAKNPLGTASSKAPLSVKPSQRLRLKRGLEDQDLTRGVKLQLSVEVEGKPKTVKWYKSNEEISQSEHVSLEKVTDEVYKLVIEKTELEDSGAYRVVLSNEAESIESSCKVTVREKVPEFKKGLGDETLPLGAPLRLEIEVDGKPNQVKWMKDGKPVDSRAKLEDLGNGRYALTIPETNADDFGQYSGTICCKFNL
jgi:hypothetical protein